ncbi:unnamed protein product [Cylicocyclus nassatus]|uniref:Uncharacterized protein n=1 Tax=Cylicocyclus nassatus TaxID=53992 RepID=A0AA36DPL2_CYLNA|nr:unnamed protein product [Cylicocyclus nassatus]
MHVASDQLIVSLAILVSHCYISSPLPLKNKTTTSAKVDNVSESMLKENSIFTSIVRQERKKRRVAVLVKRSNKSDDETLLDSTRLTRPTQNVGVKAGKKETTLGLPESSVNRNKSDTSASVTTEESTLYGVKWMKWQKYLADQQLFLPIHIPHMDENLLLRLLKDSESAKRKTAAGPTPECTEPSLFISLAFLILIGATTILCQRMRSIDFVRSPSIKYTRTVNNDAKSQLAKAKALHTELRHTPSRSAKLIISCCCIRNFAISMREAAFTDTESIPQQYPEAGDEETDLPEMANDFRRTIIDRYFT